MPVERRGGDLPNLGRYGHVVLPLVCIDVDGTLVGSSHVPTAAVWAAAERAVQRGQHLALSTGRGAFGPTLDYARRLDPDGWHIFHNGAALVHTGSGEIRADHLDASVSDLADEVAARNGWIVEFYSADDYTVDSDADAALEHAAMLGCDHTIRHRSSLDSPIVRLQFVVPLEVVPWVTTEMAPVDAIVVPATSPVMPGWAFVSCTSPGVSKASAIDNLAALLDTTAASVMMVGDGHNDVEALAAAGHGVAMGNAVAEAKAAARYEVAHVDDDGLVEALDLSAELSSRSDG